MWPVYNRPLLPSFSTGSHAGILQQSLSTSGKDVGAGVLSKNVGCWCPTVQMSSTSLQQAEQAEQAETIAQNTKKVSKPRNFGFAITRVSPDCAETPC